MNILFLKDLLPTARAGDVKNVKPGFARNYLIPQGLAVLATEEALQRTTKLRAEAEERRIQETKDWQVVAESLEGMELDLEVRTCLLYTSPSPRDRSVSRMPSSA